MRALLPSGPRSCAVFCLGKVWPRLDLSGTPPPPPLHRDRFCDPLYGWLAQAEVSENKRYEGRVRGEGPERARAPCLGGKRHLWDSSRDVALIPCLRPHAGGRMAVRWLNFGNVYDLSCFRALDLMPSHAACFDTGRLPKSKPNGKKRACIHRQ